MGPLGQTATQTATAWRCAQAAGSVTVGGLAVCLSKSLIDLSVTPPPTGGLIGGLTPSGGGLPSRRTPDRQTATGSRRRRCERGTTLGLAVIARDSEAELPALLASVEGAFDQVVLVDTGSSDRTTSIFRQWAQRQPLQLGYKVGRFEWCDDFAAARNAADDLLETDWHVRADTDETIQGAQLLRRCLVDLPQEVTMVRVPVAVGGAWCPWERVVRAGHHRWYGRIHEIQWSPGRVIDLPTPKIAWFESRGSAAGRARCGPRYRRNMAIIRDWIREAPGHPTPVALAATEEFSYGDPAAGRTQLRRYLRLERVRSCLGTQRIKTASRLIPHVAPRTPGYLSNLLGVLAYLPPWWLLADEAPGFRLGKPASLPPSLPPSLPVLTCPPKSAAPRRRRAPRADERRHRTRSRHQPRRSPTDAHRR